MQRFIDTLFIHVLQVPVLIYCWYSEYKSFANVNSIICDKERILCNSWAAVFPAEELTSISSKTLR